VEQLLAAGAKVNEGDSEGITALMYAVQGSYPAVVEKLLKSGARPDHADRHGTTPKALALKNNDRDILVILTRGVGAK
jgi:ankyrin repeat protein